MNREVMPRVDTRCRRQVDPDLKGEVCRSRTPIAGLAAFAVLLFAGIAWASPPSGTFTDDDGTTFEGGIEAIAAAGITWGCNPPANTNFLSDDQVTRGQIAIFIVRAFNLPAAYPSTFSPMTPARFTRRRSQPSCSRLA